MLGAMVPSKHMRTAIAAPAECPITSAGVMPTVAINAPRASAMPGSESWGDRVPPAGMSVNPWPGKSMVSTVKCLASKGARSRQEWVEAPVP